VLSKDRLHFCRAVKSFELIEFNNAFCEAILWSESVTSSSGLNVAILSLFLCSHCILFNSPVPLLILRLDGITRRGRVLRHYIILKLTVILWRDCLSCE